MEDVASWRHERTASLEKNRDGKQGNIHQLWKKANAEEQERNTCLYEILIFTAYATLK